MAARLSAGRGIVDPVVRVGGNAGYAVYRHKVLRARREGDDQVHFRAQADIGSRLRNWRLERNRTLLINRNIHEKIERRRDLGRRKPESSKSAFEIIRAIVVIADMSQLLVAVAVACSNEGVMHAAGRVFDEGQHRATLVATQCVTDLWVDFEHCAAAMLHRHKFRDVISAERPGIHHLAAVGVDDGDHLPFRDWAATPLRAGMTWMFPADRSRA